MFWRSTFYEISCAYIGHLKEKGALNDANKWTDDEIRGIDELKRRYPDLPPKPIEGDASDGRNRT